MQFNVQSSKFGNIVLTVATFLLFSTIVLTRSLLALTDTDIEFYQKVIAEMPLGERIASWAERFVGVPYDPDPAGEYVTRKVIVEDERVDCMYLSFRTVELALSHTPEEAVQVALDKRFVHKGTVSSGIVTNYCDRFQFGEDMLDSGKWGVEITANVGPLSTITGSRGRERVPMVSKEALIRKMREPSVLGLRSGDFIFFVKIPDKRVYGEIVGHIGIIKVDGKDIYLIHAGGEKNKGGSVKKVLFSNYVRAMPFAGIRVSRFLSP